jgi:formylglycine-generating enzyme required for sulfatase activity
MELALIKGGCFEMGDSFNEGADDEKPLHRVCLDDFYLGTHEMTQSEWKKVMGNNPSYFKNGDNYPVEQVSWNDVQSFIRKLNQQTDGKYRLTTEAEWEYACREGGRKVRYGTGTDDITTNQANYNNTLGKTTAVGSYQPNALGLYDMSGNVWEWTADWYDENYYKNSPQDNPKGSSAGSFRVYRGGSWFYNPRSLRCSDRGRYTPVYRDRDLGLRLARTP